MATTTFGRVLLSLGLALGLLLVSPVAASAETTYVVQERDTLSHIALRTGVSVSAIVEANGLEDAHRIWVGMTLVIPTGGPTAPNVETTVYVVQPGDTVSEIAVRTGTTSKILAEMNGLSSVHSIRAGQELVVPASGGITSVGTSNYPDLPDRITSRPERVALIPYFEKWAAANDLPVDLLMAIAWQESGWNNEAVSHKGAVGIGQIMPDTGVWVATDLIAQPQLDPTNPEDNIRISARFLRWLLDYTGDETLAIASYYQGPGSVASGELFGSTEQYLANVEVHRPFFARTS